MHRTEYNIGDLSYMSSADDLPTFKTPLAILSLEKHGDVYSIRITAFGTPFEIISLIGCIWDATHLHPIYQMEENLVGFTRSLP